MPRRWGGTLSRSGFPSPPCRCSWPLCFGGVGRRRHSGWGREGQRSIFKLLQCSQIWKLIIISNLKNVMPAPPLSNLRSRKQHYHWQVGTTFGTGHEPTDHTTGQWSNCETIYILFLIGWGYHWQHYVYLSISRLCGHPVLAGKKAEGVAQGVQQRVRARAPYF